MSTALAQYDAMRLQVQHCARVDEAATLRNKADKLRAYAKQAKDHELQRWMSEISLRATIRLGQLSGELQGASGSPPGKRGGKALPSGGQTKAEALADAGVSHAVAQRAEALAGVRNDLDDESGVAVEALGVALETAEIYFQQCRQAETTPNHRQLNGIIQATLDDRFGKPARPGRKAKRSAFTNAFIDWTAAVGVLATLDVELPELASHELCSSSDLDHAEKALARLQEWVDLMEEKHVGIGSGDIGTRTVREGAQGVSPA
jgi:hypothetical protein